MKKSLLILSIFIFTTLTANANDFMSKALDSWIEYSINDVIAVWGYPKSEKQIAGRNLIYWTNSQYHVSGNQYYVSGGESFCNKIFEVDKKNKIISWQYEGNSCPSFYFTGKGLVNPQNDEWQVKKQIKRELRAERKRLKKEVKLNKENL